MAEALRKSVCSGSRAIATPDAPANTLHPVQCVLNTAYAMSNVGLGSCSRSNTVLGDRVSSLGSDSYM